LLYRGKREAYSLVKGQEKLINKIQSGRRGEGGDLFEEREKDSVKRRDAKSLFVRGGPLTLRKKGGKKEKGRFFVKGGWERKPDHYFCEG